jgi:hypothetical protein
MKGWPEGGGRGGRPGPESKGGLSECCNAYAVKEGFMGATIRSARRVLAYDTWIRLWMKRYIPLVCKWAHIWALFFPCLSLGRFFPLSETIK